MNKGKEGAHGILSQVYVDKLLALKPAFFLFENVPGLLKTNKHRIFLAELMEQLTREFVLDVNFLNALEYGVPQNRNRVFLLGFNKNWLKIHSDLPLPVQPVSWLPILDELRGRYRGKNNINSLSHSWFPWPEPEKESYRNALNKYDWPTTAPFGSKNIAQPDSIPAELMVGPLICDINETSSLPNGMDAFRPKSNKFHEIMEGDTSGKSFKRLHRWRYSPVAAYGNNEVHLHPTQPRRLTVREAMRIQTVPDQYALPPSMSLSKKFKTIGNGVPVMLASYIATSFKQFLKEKTNAKI